MKQQISLKQWQELSLGEQRRFQEALGHGGLPTIGDMIEYLEGNLKEYQDRDSDYNHGFWTENLSVQWSTNLCDDLWARVSKNLES
jgi:hypothetical protein